MKKFEKTKTTMKGFEKELCKKFNAKKMHKRKHLALYDEYWIEGVFVIKNARGKNVTEWYHADCGLVGKWLNGVAVEYVPTLPRYHKATTIYILSKIHIGEDEHEDSKESCGEFVDLEEAKRFALATDHSLIELDESEKDAETGLWCTPEDGGVSGGFRDGELEYMDGITKEGDQ